MPWTQRSDDVLFSADKSFAIIFRFYDLSAQNAEQNPQLGFYVVVGTIQTANGEEVQSLGRGFWEVVPEDRFPSIDRLAAATRLTNLNFASDTDFVEYTMSNQDVVRLSLGFPHSSVAAFSKILTAAGQEWTDDVKRARQKRHEFPLINVLEVDKNFQLNGHRLAFSSGDGEVTITNRFVNMKLTLDSSNFLQPKRKNGPLT